MNKLIIVLLIALGASCSSSNIKTSQPEEKKSELITNVSGKGPEIIIEFTKGSSFYYPLMAVWLEDMAGNYIQTLYVPVSVATGIFKYGRQERNRWISGSKRAPQILPYWSHKRGIKASDGLYMPEPENPVPDAYTGATPTESFILSSRADKDLPDTFRVMFEINQNWDWNEYWTNDKYPEDENYKMSCQPALVYEAVVDRTKSQGPYTMNVTGHSHYSGKNGDLFKDLSTITTALSIADSIVVRIR